MPKKVGILTFQNANNYGAVLQAFALQQTLIKLGAEPEIINYDSENMGLKRVQTDLFSSFNKEFLNLSDEYTKNRDIDIKPYDIILTGSDQVWNPTITRGDTTYFLDFVNGRKEIASYAASIGLTGKELHKYESLFKKTLNSMKGISIREKEQEYFLKGILGHEVRVDLDPTLLLNIDEYCRFFNVSKSEKKYIFMYTNNVDEKIVDFVNLVSIYYKMPVIAVSNFDEHNFTNGSQAYWQVNPIEWVDSIANAGLVVTDSFHGLMMSLVFEKPFYIFSKKRTNISRITNVLEECDLCDRTLKNITDVSKISMSVDFRKTREYVTEGQSKAFKYLSDLIS